MKMKRYKKPEAVEQHILHVKPDMVERWIELDHEIWTEGLMETDRRFNELFGEGNARLVEEVHNRNQFYRVCGTVEDDE